jgi:hypothetical protein
MTGDLDWLGNVECRELLKKGPKYKEAQPLNWEELVASISDSFDPLFTVWRTKLPKELKKKKHGRGERAGGEEREERDDWFSKWKTEVLRLVNQRVTRVKKWHLPSASPCLDKPEVRAFLKKLHRDFVLVPADKSDNNVIIVCKQYFIQCLFKELLPLSLDKPQTYELQEDTVAEVSARLKTVLKSAGIDVPDDDDDLPFMYWAAKMHKDPLSQRYITTSLGTVTKPLSQLVCKCLKLVQEQMSRHCKLRQRRDGVRRFWIASSTEGVLRDVRQLNLLRWAKSLATYDFATLYTNIPHDRLKQMMRWVIEKAFEANKSYPYIAVWSKSASWKKKQNKKSTYLDQATLIKLVELVLDNLYVKCGDMVFRQLIGIPMGSDCAPFLANLYLLACEYQWLDKMVESGPEGLATARKFKWTRRYIDDLLTFNNEGILGELSWFGP